METLIVINPIGGAAKIRLFKQLSQRQLATQPILLSLDAEDASQGSLHRTILRIRELYLDHRPVIIAGSFDPKKIQCACARFHVGNVTAINGQCDLQTVLAQTICALEKVTVRKPAFIAF